MKNSFYAKLAFKNVRKNAKTLVPFLIVCTLIISRFYIMADLNDVYDINEIDFGSAGRLVLNIGTYATGVFAIVFLFYIYSLLFNRRKKEFGLYNVLGLGKRQISKIVSLEILFMGAVSIALGIIYGMVFSRLTYMLLQKTLNFKVTLDGMISPLAIVQTVGLFAIVFLFVLIYTLIKLRLSNTSQLLKPEGAVKEKPMILLLLLGICCLVSGYIILCVFTEMHSTLYLAFASMILIIAGTYCVFLSAGSVFLRVIRKRKKFYYSSKHFVPLTGALTRIRENAVGLGNICILMTAVLVLVSSGVCLYGELENMTDVRYQSDYMVAEYSANNQNVLNTVYDVLSEHNAEAKSTNQINVKVMFSLNDGDIYSSALPEDKIVDCVSLYVMSLDDYNRITGSNFELLDNHAIVYDEPQSMPDGTIRIENISLKVDNASTTLPFALFKNEHNHYPVIVVVNNPDIFDRSAGFTDYISTGINVDLPYNEQIDVYSEIHDRLEIDSRHIVFTSRAYYRSQLYGTYGGVMFIGIFLGLLFIFATVLAIYYKQIFDGYEDKKRFQLMQGVGLSKKEVMKAIRYQVSASFFVPLITAVVHVAFMFPFIIKFFEAMNTTNIGLLVICTAITVAVFVFAYSVVYAITVRKYYKIVE